MMAAFAPGETLPPPPGREGIPTKERVLSEVIDGTDGCLLWLGDFSRDGMAVILRMFRRKRSEFQVVRVLYYHTHGVFPTNPLYRMCETQNCVALAHRQEGRQPKRQRTPPQFVRQGHSYAQLTRGAARPADIHGPRRTNGT